MAMRLERNAFMRRTLFVMTLVAAFAVLGGGHAFAQASAPPATWSVTDCQGCHEKALGPGFTHTKHAGLELSCAQCHKNVGEHAKAQLAGEGPAPSVRASEMPHQQTCTREPTSQPWPTSKRAPQPGCTSCHSNHSISR
jgi:hypothetical protein